MSDTCPPDNCHWHHVVATSQLGRTKSEGKVSREPVPSELPTLTDKEDARLETTPSSIQANKFSVSGQPASGRKYTGENIQVGWSCLPVLYADPTTRRPHVCFKNSLPPSALDIAGSNPPTRHQRVTAGYSMAYGPRRREGALQPKAPSLQHA